jgi:hypothetical protein
MKRDVGKAVSILSDILLNSKLEERSIERERDVILREMEEVRKGAGRGGRWVEGREERGRVPHWGQGESERGLPVVIRLGQEGVGKARARGQRPLLQPPVDDKLPPVDDKLPASSQPCSGARPLSGHPLPPALAGEQADQRAGV